MTYIEDVFTPAGVVSTVTVTGGSVEINTSESRDQFAPVLVRGRDVGISYRYDFASGAHEVRFDGEHVTRFPIGSTYNALGYAATNALLRAAGPT